MALSTAVGLKGGGEDGDRGLKLHSERPLPSL